MMRSASSLTIVIVVDSAAMTGGQSKVAFDSAIGLRDRGHEPILFTASGPVDPAFARTGVRVVCLDQPELLGGGARLGGAVQGLWNRPAAAALAQLLAECPAGRTLVHVHGWAKSLSPSIAQPIRRSRLPAIYTSHEYFLFCPNGGFFDHPAGAICTRRPMSLDCITTNCDSRHYAHKVWRVARQALANHVARLVDVFDDVIVLSELEDSIVAPLLGDRARLHRIADPVEAVDQGPKPMPDVGEVTFVGRLSAEKGAVLFAEAAQRAGITPVFVGDGPLAGEIRTCFPQAVMNGWQPFPAVASAMRAARALVFPSVWYETFGLTAYEALAAGTPVVVSDACAARAAVADGVNGFWFRSGDADDLAAKLRQLADDALVTRLSAAAYAGYWADPPTRDRHVDQICELYESVMTRSSPLRRTPRAVQAAAELEVL